MEKLDTAQALIEKCVKAAKKHTRRVTTAPSERTQVFRAGFLQELLEIKEEPALLEYLCTHYYIYNPAYSGVRMMYSAQQNTARELYHELTGAFLEEYPEAFGSLNDHVELNNGIDLPALLEQLAQENEDDGQFLQILEPGSPFAALLASLDKKLRTQKSRIFKLYNDPEAAAAHPYTRTELITLYYCYFLNVLQELVEDYGILDLPQLYEEFCDGDGIRPGINYYLSECRYQSISEKNPFDMFVIFSVFSDRLSFGVNFRSPLFLMAASLYTPPNAGLSFAVMRFVPTPQDVIFAPCCFSESIRYSSRSEEAEMTAFLKPASSSILRAFFER